MRPLYVTVLCVCIASLFGAQLCASSNPGTNLILPYYEVSQASSDGITTMWSVFNVTASTVQIEVHYWAVDGGNGAVVSESFNIPPAGTKTRNIRDVPGAPPQGSVHIRARMPDDPWNPLPEAIVGDFFWVEPGDSFASGGVLLRDHMADAFDAVPVPKQSDLCQEFETRFFNGGTFSGGTDFIFYATWKWAVPYTEPIATGNFYDEAGNYTGFCTITGNGYLGNASFAEKVNTQVLAGDCPSLPTFGRIDWYFASGVVGHVTARHRALGKYSVSTPGFCTLE